MRANLVGFCQLSITFADSAGAGRLRLLLPRFSRDPARAERGTGQSPATFVFGLLPGPLMELATRSMLALAW